MSDELNDLRKLAGITLPNSSDYGAAISMTATQKHYTGFFTKFVTAESVAIKFVSKVSIINPTKHIQFAPVGF